MWLNMKKMGMDYVETERIYENEKGGKCFKKFIKENNLRKHEETSCFLKPFQEPFHLLEKGSKCNFCQKVFTLPRLLRHHIQTSHLPLTIVNDGNECDICKKKFTETYQLKNHIKADHLTVKLAIGATDKAYECNACEEIFDKHDIDTHVYIHMCSKAVKYSEGKPVKCSFCDKMFITNRSLKEHYKICKYQKQSERPYKCDTCFKTFAKLMYLKTHLRIHTGEQPFSCNFCDELFRHRTSWNRHEKTCLKRDATAIAGSSESGTKSVDSITITFDCDICHETFPEKNLMNDHKRTHDEVRQFQCKICRNTFDKSDDLRFHLRKYHVNEQILVGMDKILYECDNCKETFKNDSDLHTHLKIYMIKVSDHSLPEVIQNELKVENSEFPSASVLVEKPPMGENLFLQPSQNSIEVTDNFRIQNFVQPMILVLTAQNTILPMIANNETQLVQTEISKVQKCCNSLVQHVENDINQEDKISSMKPNCFSDKALSDMNQISTIATDKMTPVESNRANTLKAESSQCVATSKLHETRNKTKQKDVASYQCRNCVEIFNSTKDLTAHLRIKNHKPGRMFYQCGTCLIGCGTLKELQIHKKVKHWIEELKYHCDICRKVCDSKKQLLKHKKEQHKSVLQVNQCDKCPNTYKSSEMLLRHKEIHTVMYECKVCKEKYIGDLDLNHHLLKQHVSTNDANGKRSYKCRICRNISEEKNDIEIHMKNHIKTNFKKIVIEQEFVCYICQKILKKEPLLIDHMKKHAEFKEYVCGICKKEEYKYTDELKEHLIKKHVNKGHLGSGDCSYRCRNCGKTFICLQNMDAHLETYVIKKTFKIDYVQSGHHYKCNLCDHTFIAKNALGYHMEIHDLRNEIKDIF